MNEDLNTRNDPKKLLQTSQSHHKLLGSVDEFTKYIIDNSYTSNVILFKYLALLVNQGHNCSYSIKHLVMGISLTAS